jgi:hypothetical protein
VTLSLNKLFSIFFTIVEKIMKKKTMLSLYKDAMMSLSNQPHFDWKIKSQ